MGETFWILICGEDPKHNRLYVDEEGQSVWSTSVASRKNVDMMLKLTEKFGDLWMVLVRRD